MTKSELIDVMATNAGLSKKDAASALNAFTDAVTDTLAKGDKLAL